jgi:peptidyl-prolyl cis-trans isomerase D
LKVARKDLDAEVEQKAKELIAKLRGTTGQATEEAFAEAARGNSEEPISAGNKGYISKLVKKNPNKPDALYERAVDMQVGDVSDIPIKFANNWYILRRGDAVPKTFEEAKPELLVSLRNRRGFGVAFKLATEAQKRLKEVKDVQKVAQEFAAQANMTPAEMVRETSYIKPGDDVPDIGANQQFEQAVGALNNPGDVGESTGVKNGFAVPLLRDKKEPRIPEFDEVKTKIADALKREKANQQLEQQAKDLVASLSAADALKAAGEKAGFESGTEDAYRLGGKLGEAGTSTAVDDVIFGMKAGELHKTPVKVGDTYVIVGVTKRTEADMADFEKQKDSLKSSLATDRQNQLFEDYIAGVTRRMKESGQIKVYDDVLDTIQEDEPAALPGGLNCPG